MTDAVYANGMQIACKEGAGKVVAAFPDVCLSPPSPPAGPIPVPYPLTSMDSDTSDGSRTVLIGGKEVMLKDKSFYKKCNGDEPATKTLGMGVVSHNITGKTYFVMWSSDVLIEGENADRNLDTTNSNGQSTTNQFVWPNLSKMTVPGGNCAEILSEAGITIHKYKDADKVCKKGEQQSDHIVQNACFENVRGGGGISACPNYQLGNAPCICLEDGTNPKTEHGRKTAAQNDAAKGWRERDKNPTYAETRDANLNAMQEARPALKENKEALECIKLVVDDHFKNQLELDDDDEVRTPRGGKFPDQPPAQAPAINLGP